MKNSPFSRRDFIKSAGVAGGLLLLEPPASAQTIKDFIFRRRCRDAGAIVRKSFKNLTAAELAAFKNGVAVMKSRATNDPTSWAYQAAIHGTTLTPNANGMEHLPTQHHAFLFLAPDGALLF